MDASRFDELSRAIAGSRRSVLRLLAGGLAGGLLPAADAAASACASAGKKCKKGGQCCSGLCHRRKGRCLCKAEGAPCGTDVQCCGGSCRGGTCAAACLPEDETTTCGAACGQKQNNCGQTVDCGGCHGGKGCEGGRCVFPEAAYRPSGSPSNSSANLLLDDRLTVSVIDGDGAETVVGERTGRSRIQAVDFQARRGEGLRVIAADLVPAGDAEFCSGDLGPLYLHRLDGGAVQTLDPHGTPDDCSGGGARGPFYDKTFMIAI